MRRAVFAALLLVGALSLAGCGRPVGDLGSVGPGPYGSNPTPLSNTTTARASLYPSDEEGLMRDRIWQFEQAPYARDWVLTDGYWPAGKKPDAYFVWLSRQPYSSSQSRYRALADNVASDLDMLPPTFDAICAVEQLDRRRGISAAGVDDPAPAILNQTAVRGSQDELEIRRFANALAFRHAAFSYALDQLLVAIPQPDAVAIDTDLTRLGRWVDRATADDYCTPAWAPGAATQAALPSRVLMDRTQSAPLPPK